VRFQPNSGVTDASTVQAFDQVSRVLDATTRVPAFGFLTAAVVQVSAGEFKRLAPRSGGQTVVLPEASAINAGLSVFLLVNGLGTLTVKPVSGTVNGSASAAFAAGAYAVELTSDGEGRWLTRTVPDGSVTTAKLAALSVTSAKLAADAVTTAKIADDQVTNAKLANMSARRIKGREDGVAAGDPQDLVGAEVGEIVRFNSSQSDTTATGTIVTYTLAEGTNVVRFLVGIAATTIRGATIPSEQGQLIFWENNDGTGANVTFNHEDGSAAAAGNRFRCPGGVARVMTPGSRFMTVYINDRHRIIE
jgi:hypothetical protein